MGLEQYLNLAFGVRFQVLSETRRMEALAKGSAVGEGATVKLLSP